jgi:hypothetical protein
MSQPQRKGQKRSSARWTPIEMVGALLGFAQVGSAGGQGREVLLKDKISSTGTWHMDFYENVHF